MRKSPKFHLSLWSAPCEWCSTPRTSTRQWAAIESIAGKIGCTAETVRRWVRRGVREVPATPEQQRVKDLERKLRRANDILKLASAFFAQAELDRR